MNWKKDCCLDFIKSMAAISWAQNQSCHMTDLCHTHSYNDQAPCLLQGQLPTHSAFLHDLHCIFHLMQDEGWWIIGVDPWQQQTPQSLEFWRATDSITIFTWGSDTSWNNFPTLARTFSSKHFKTTKETLASAKKNIASTPEWRRTH